MKPTLLLALLLVFAYQGTTQVIFVKQGATGTGTSWQNALGSLDNALQQATFGDEIRVAKGTYHPTSTADRKASFVIPDGVKVYGGFEGTEFSREERNLSQNPTILSGEIGKPGIADNSFNVILTKNVSGSTVIDGFIIKGGNASGEGRDASRDRSGGAWYNDGSGGGISNPVISNCVFRENYGRDGAAIYNNGQGGESSPTLTNCTFSNNEAGLDGGAIYNNSRNRGKSNPVLVNCTFEKNVGTYGGAIFNAIDDGVCNLYLENCSFTENMAYLRGGAVFSMNGKENCYLEFSDCLFEGNYPDDQNKIFTNNTARSSAYRIVSSSPSP